MNPNQRTLVRNVVHIGFANDVLFGLHWIRVDICCNEDI